MPAIQWSQDWTANPGGGAEALASLRAWPRIPGNTGTPDGCRRVLAKEREGRDYPAGWEGKWVCQYGRR